MAEVYIYRPDCQDLSTIGECGRMDASLCDCEMVANGLIEITLEHPIDRLGRYRLLQENWILKTEIPVLTTPEIEGGAYVTSVERWTVSPGATKAQRTVWSKASGGRKKKVLKANSAVTVTSAPATGSRYKVKTGKTAGWMESAALVNKVTETIPATATGIEQAVPSWELREQTFRIYHVDQTDRKVTVNAKARSYDLAYNLTTYNTDGAVSLQAALDGIFGNTLDSHEAEAYTDINGTRVGVHARDMNPIQALLDPENGLCARWNAQLVRDEMDFFLLAHAGRDRGLRIEFARNLAGIHMSTNIDDVFTHVRPIGETKAGGPLYLESNQGLMACPKAASYPFKRIYPLKVSEAKVDKQVSTALARTRMTQAAQALIDTGIDEPDVDAKIAFERLGDSPRYQQYRALKDRAFLYDTIAIHHPVLGIDISAQVCRLKWDCLREKTKDMDIGSLAKLAPSVSSWQLSGNINGSKLADGTVGGVALVDGAVDVRHLQAESVNADAIQAESVTAGKVAAGAITTEKLNAGAVTADKLAANAVTAAKIDANSVSAAVVETDAFEAATADIAQAEIGSADIGFAQIKDANVEQLIARDAVTGRYYIRKLQVDNAQMVQATVGALVIKAGDGKYYRLDFDSSGNLTPTEVTLTQGEIAAGETADGRGSIIETDLTVTDLAASNMKAINALIDKITTKRLYATQAFIDELHTSMITDDDFVNIVVGVGNAQSAAEAAQQDIDNLSVGGRNFVRNSEALRSLTRTMTANTAYLWNPDNPWLLSDYAKAILNADDYPETLIVSFDAKASKGGCKFGISVRSDANQLGYLSVAALVKSANTWARYSIPLTRNSGSDDYVLTHLRPNLTAPSDGSATFEIRRMKLELGSRSTDWTPAPEDTDADITAAQTAADGAASAASIADGKAVAAQTAADGAAADAAAAQATANAKADPMTATAHGGEIAVSDSAEAAIGGLVLYGRSEQGGQTTGKNLVPYECGSANGTANVPAFEIRPDGGLHISGTMSATGGYRFHFASSGMLNLPAGTYRFLLTGSGTGFDNVNIQLYTDTGAGMASRNYGKDFTYTITSSVTADYVRIRCAAGTYDCVVYPMVMLSSETDTTFEPYTGGIPAPNPQFPCLLHSAGMTLGKNLLNDERGGGAWSGATFTPLEDGGYHITGTATATVQYNPYLDATILNLPHGMYHFILTGSGTGVGDVKMQLYVNNNDGNGLVVASGWQNTDWMYTIRDSAIANNVRIRVAAGTYDCVVYPMVLPAYTDDTSFEGYTNGPVGTRITLTCADDAQGTNAAHTTLPTPNGLPGIAVSSGGNYTDENGQQWICDTIDLAAGTYTKRCGMIPGYDGETIPGAYLSTTGGLTAGATVVYALATPVTTPLTEAQLTALRSLRTRDGTTVLTNDAGADMDLTYATQTGGGSYVEGVRQGLDDGIGKAQGAADAAQVTADAAREDFRRVVRIDTEGLHVGDSQTSNEVMIDSESVNVVLGGRKYSKFAGDYVQFGDYQLRRSVDGGLVFKKA